MAVQAVQDVTTTLWADKTEKTTIRSDITPFAKVLSEKEKLYTVQTKQTSKADKTDTVKSTTTLKEIFERAAEKYDISYDFLVAVAKAESDFNTNCVSSAGAQGIMQVMPSEQKGLGIKDPFDAEQNIMGAAKLLKAHLKKFNGDYTLAAAAYNAGSGRVQKYGGVPPFKETQNYVKKVEKYRKQGVEVPDKAVKVSKTSDTKTTKKTTESKETFDTGKTATDSDWEKVTVAVGSGNDTITMSYGAYLKYLELGSSGVG